uniref:uncharacterized protein n=1 Tax=Myxine glutinosa TaxID=7769 RepID=UPI00358E92CB
MDIIGEQVHRIFVFSVPSHLGSLSSGSRSKGSIFVKMSHILMKYLKDNDLEMAVQRAMRPGTSMISFTRLRNVKCQNLTYMMAQLLHIKVGSPTRMPTSTVGKIRKVEMLFMHLILLREIRDGTLFYIKCKTAKDSNKLFLKQNQRWIGTFVLVNEPVYFDTELFGIPLVETDCPFLPITPDWQGIEIVTHSAARVVDGKMSALYSVVDDMMLGHESIEFGCGNAACDGVHSNTKPCFSLDGGMSTAMSVFSCRISSREMNIVAVKYSSRDLGTYFLHPAYLMSGENVSVWDEDDIRKHVRLVLHHYASAGIKWIIAGWSKPSQKSEQTVAVSRLFHLSLVKPERRLADAPIMLPPKKALPNPTVDAIDDTEDPCQSQEDIGELIHVVPPAIVGRGDNVILEPSQSP